MNKLPNTLKCMTFAIVNLYIIGLLSWFVLHMVFADRWGLLFLLNSFSIYAFVPLIAIVPMALLTGRRMLIIGSGIALVAGIMLHGATFVPRHTPVLAAGQPAIKVMTYNVLGFNINPEGIASVLRESQADVISIEELNPENAHAIEHTLADVYPYQILRPQVGTTGTGIISRYPLRQATELSVGPAWADRSHILAYVDIGGREILFMQFHAVPPSLGNLHATVRLREQQAQNIADFAQSLDIPFIAAGDFNATDTSLAYANMTSVLSDSWKEAGWGTGHTFPGAAGHGSSRLQVGPLVVPQWLVRIDYIFHSNEWQTLSADIGPWDGQSDHRPVMATLALK